MKDIIQTRNSFKKRHRLSARSDDTKPEEGTFSDNEDVFLDSPGPSGEKPRVFKSKSQSSIPSEVIQRYQRIIAEEKMVRIKILRKNLKIHEKMQKK